MCYVLIFWFSWFVLWETHILVQSLPKFSFCSGSLLVLKQNSHWLLNKMAKFFMWTEKCNWNFTNLCILCTVTGWSIAFCISNTVIPWYTSNQFTSFYFYKVDKLMNVSQFASQFLLIWALTSHKLIIAPGCCQFLNLLRYAEHDCSISRSRHSGVKSIQC